MTLGSLGSLSEYEKADLLESAMYWLATEPKTRIRELGNELSQCFDGWKISQANSLGEVESFAAFGLLSISQKGELTPVGMVQPWHCAGPYVRNEIDLAFKLWLESYLPFDALLKTFGIPLVFSYCALAASINPEVNIGSLIRVSGFLSKHLSQFAAIVSDMAMENFKLVKKRRAQNNALIKAREQSARIRKEKASEKLTAMRRMAHEYFQNNPSHGTAEAVLHVKKFSPLSLSTIKTKIKGVKAQALRSLHSGIPKRV